MGPDHRHRRQRGPPGLRHSRGLEHPPGHPARLLDGPHGGTASGTGASSSSGNDRDSAVGPGHSQSEVVETDTGSRVASPHEVSEKHHFLCPGRPQAAGASLRPPAGYAWIGQGTAFAAAAKRRCTLLAIWYAEQEEPWVILTDLPPAEAGPGWYALRFWIELGFKALQSLGWEWDKTRRTDPARVSRHGWCCRWRRCWPWPMAPGWRRP